MIDSELTNISDIIAELQEIMERKGDMPVEGVSITDFGTCLSVSQGKHHSYEEGFEEGFQKGKSEGFDDGYEEAEYECEEKLSNLRETVAELTEELESLARDLENARIGALFADEDV